MAGPYRTQGKIWIGEGLWMLSYDHEWKEGCIRAKVDQAGSYPAGMLLTSKVDNYCKRIARAKSDFVRVLPYLLADETYRNPHIGTYTGMLPYGYFSPKFRLSAPNMGYWEHVRNMAKIANDNGLIFFYSLFDACHGYAKTGPWENNEEGLPNLWYGTDSKTVDIVKKHVNMACDALSGLRCWFEVENEPRKTEWLGMYRRVFDILRSRGVHRADIFSGAELYPFDKDQTNLKNEVDGLGPDHRLYQCSAVHKFDDERAKWIGDKFGNAENAIPDGRCFAIATDGCKHKPTAQEGYELFTRTRYFYRNPQQKELGGVVEFTIAPYKGDGDVEDLVGSSYGAYRAYQEYLDNPDVPEDPEEPPIPPPDDPDDPEDPEDPETPDDPEDPEEPDTPEDPDDPGPPTEEDDDMMPKVNFKAAGESFLGVLIFLKEILVWFWWLVKTGVTKLIELFKKKKK